MRKVLKKEKVILAVLFLGVLGVVLLPQPRLDLGNSAEEQKITADSPFTIHFTQAMNRKSAELAFSMIPAIEKDFIWKNGKTLEVRPKTTLTIGDRYRIRLKEGAKSIYGKPLREPPPLVFSVTGPPFVRWVSPREGVIGPNQVITVMFDRPMAPPPQPPPQRGLRRGLQQDPAVSFLKIDPSVKGKTEWITPAVFQFTPEEWPKASLFRLTVPGGLPSGSGGATTEDFNWALKTPAPRVVQSAPQAQETLARNGVIQLEFNQKIDLEGLRPGNNVLLYPSNDLDADKNPREDGFFNGEITHGADPKTLVFTPAFPYQPDRDYRLVIKAGLKGEGELVMKDDFELPFHVLTEADENLEDPEQPLAATFCKITQAVFFEINERFGWQEYDCSTGEKMDYRPLENGEDLLGLNIQEILKKDIAPGIYFLALQKGGQRFARPFFKTSGILRLEKFSGESLAWALDERGRPLSGMILTFFDRAGKVLGEGKTDERGLYLFQRELEEGLHVMGKKGNAMPSTAGRPGGRQVWAMVGDERQSQISPLMSGADLALYFNTDKAGYSAGETLYFNGLFRRLKGGELEFPERAKIEMKIEDRDRETRAALEPLPGHYGSFYGTWTIPDSFKPGRYFVVIHMTQNDEKSSFEREFVIQDPERPALIVRALNAKSDYVVGERITLDFESASSSGFAGVGLKGAWILSDQASSERVAGESLVWDERGKARLTFDPEKIPLKTGAYSLWIEAEEFDGRRAGTRVDFKVHQGSYDLELTANRYWGRAGEEITLSLAARSDEGDLLEGKRGVLMWSGEKIQVETEKSPVLIPFKLPSEPGVYKVRAESKDEKGRLLQTQIQVLGTAPDFSSSSDTLELILDQPDYLAGGKAKLLILAPRGLKLPKKALLTYGRETLLSHQLIDLENPAQPVDILIQESMAPRFRVTVSVFDEDRQALVSGQAVLNVSAREKEIKIDLTPQITEADHQKKVTLKIHSYDYQGLPVPAQLSIRVAEKPVPLADPRETFYADRPPEVISDHELRENKTFYFNSAVKADVTGFATVEFTLPSGFITGEIQAIAAAQADRFGAVKMPLEVRRTPFLRPHLPTVVAAGDRFTMQTEMINTANDDFETKIELIAPDLKIMDAPQKRVFLKKGETALITWAVAMGETEKSSIQVAFRTPETFAAQEIGVDHAPSAYQSPDFLEFIIRSAFKAENIFEEKEGLQKDLNFLKSFETSEGGYSLWAGAETPNPFFSAYALFLFREAPQKELIHYLWKTLENDETLSLEQRIFIVWALSEAGEYDTKATLTLFQKRTEAPLAAQGLLLLNVHRLVQAGQKSMAPLIERLKSELVSHAAQDEGRASFEETKASYFESPRELTEILFFALKEVSPDNPLLGPLMNYLTSSPQNQPDVSGDLILQRTVPAIFKQGDVVRGTLEIFVPRDLSHVILKEPLPAGLRARALDLRLADPSVQDREEEKAYREGVTFIPNSVWHFNHHEIRPDHFVLFAEHLPAGRYTINFLAEAVHVGEFRHPPAFLYSLFDKKARAFTPEEMIKIQ